MVQGFLLDRFDLRFIPICYKPRKSYQKSTLDRWKGDSDENLIKFPLPHLFHEISHFIIQFLFDHKADVAEYFIRKERQKFQTPEFSNLSRLGIHMRRSDKEKEAILLPTSKFIDAISQFS